MFNRTTLTVVTAAKVHLPVKSEITVYYNNIVTKRLLLFVQYTFKKFEFKYYFILGNLQY